MFQYEVRGVFQVAIGYDWQMFKTIVSIDTCDKTEAESLAISKLSAIGFLKVIPKTEDTVLIID